MATDSRCVTLFFLGAFIPQIDGAHMRATSLLDRLAAEFPNVVVYAFENHDEYSWDAERQLQFKRRWPTVELVLEPRSHLLVRAAGFKRLALSLFPRQARRILGLAIPKATPRFDALKARTAAWVVNYQAGLSQLNGVDPDVCFVETHDLTFIKAAKLSHRSPVSLPALLQLRAEVGALEVARGLFAISPAEAAFFKMVLSAPSVFYVSSWISPIEEALSSAAAPADYDLIFVGSAYAMNARGLCALYEQSGGWLSRFTLAVCGRVCENPEVIALAKRHPTIHLLGYVDDVDPVYARCKAALSPVDGTGLKMKITAALAAGRPVFASAQSMDGLPGDFEAAIFKLEEAVMTSVLTDPVRLAAAQAAAKRYDRVRLEAGETAQAIEAIWTVISA